MLTKREMPHDVAECHIQYIIIGLLHTCGFLLPRTIILDSIAHREVH
jgi:hypothetical protein|eukprot:COSAG01_NODE_6604_length_3585_cov_2.439185_3_plen_47_part_00